MYVRIKLKPSDDTGRLSAELSGAWNLKPYRGKPTVRNFRGGGWRRDHGSRTEAHVERRGTATGPYRVCASAPPDNMPGTPRPDHVSTKQQRIAELARNCPDMAFTTLAHHIDIEWMLTAHARTRKDGAVGVDGQTADEYEVNLEANLQNLLDRAKSGTYVAPPVRRVHIPKAGSPNETRPLGIPTYEDKILQRAVLMVLEPVYETDFLDVSHGFRPGRGAHGALQSLWQQEMKMGGGWIVDVDLRKFFDTIDHGHLREFLKRRVRDGVILRLIGKWLNAGVLEDGVRHDPRARHAARRGDHAPNNVAKTSLIPDSVISRARLRPKYGQGWQPRLDPHPRQADGRARGEEEST